MALYYSAATGGGLILLGFVLLLTPTGRLPSPRWRWWARAMVAVPLGLLVVVTLAPGPVDPYQQVLAGPFDFRGLDGALLVVNRLALVFDSPISRRFLGRFPNQDAADWLSPTRLGAWLRAAGYCGRKSAQQLYAHLAAAPRGATGPDGAARAHITRALLAAIATVADQITQLEAHIREQLQLHPDQQIFTSLPRSGTVRAARLLAEIGDCRGRFPTPQALACLAGVAPSTRQSGRHRAVAFRWSCDKQLRDAVCDFAGDSRRASPWAARLYQQAIDRGHDHAHATRILARAWLGVIWRCWQDHQPYQPAKHGALQALTNTTNPAA